MKTLFIYFTKCSSTYASLYKDKLYSEKSDGEREIFEGFYDKFQEEKAYLIFENTGIKIVYDYPNTINVSYSVLLIQDEADINKEGVRNNLKKILAALSDKDIVVVFFHRNNIPHKTTFLSIYDNILNGKPRIVGRDEVFSHVEGDTTNPFYRLSELWDCNSNKGFEEKLNEFKETWFPSADVILGKKLDLLHSLLAPPTDEFKDAEKQWAAIKKTVEEANKNRSDDEKLSLATDENALTTFETSVSNITGAFDKPYLEALTTLRDKLLV